MRVLQMLVTQVMYPFNIVSNVMAVNNSGSVDLRFVFHSSYSSLHHTNLTSDDVVLLTQSGNSVGLYAASQTFSFRRSETHFALLCYELLALANLDF